MFVVVRKIIVVCLLNFFVVACGHFQGMGAQVGNGGYRGMGEMTYPSDYSPERTEQQVFSPSGPFKMHWPVRKAKVNRGFRPPSDPGHHGLDLGGSKGTLILAAHEGLVIYTGRDFRGYGNMVIVEYDKEWATLYAHLSDFTVREGDVVRAGDPLGKMGRTGNASGVHLHLELLHNRTPVDPMPYLTGQSKWVWWNWPYYDGYASTQSPPESTNN